MLVLIRRPFIGVCVEQDVLNHQLKLNNFLVDDHHLAAYINKHHLNQSMCDNGYLGCEYSITLA